MKRLYILLLAVALTGLGRAFGQSFTVSPGDTFTYSGTLNTITDSHEDNGYFVYTSSASNVIYWRLLAYNMDSLWQMSFCDPYQCYYFTSGSAANFQTHHATIDSGSNLLRFGVSPSCSADSGNMVVLTWLISDSAASAKTLYFSASYTGSCLSAIQNVTTPQLSVYPNPVNSLLTVDGLNNMKNVKITVFDILGNIAIEKYVSQPAPMASLNTGSLQQGVYFVTIDSEGARVLTKRIQKLD